MAQKSSSHDNTEKAKQRQSSLPVPIHPDDAKDKVFTAILKALLKMGNKPSSPKELANIIVKHKYATLGGATPFATVSSRISQHFKRAAEHNPPRAPLLAKHVDQNHSRKINYSLATESVSNNSNTVAKTHDDDDDDNEEEEDKEDTTAATIEEDSKLAHTEDPSHEEEEEEESNEISQYSPKKHKSNRYHRHSITESIHPIQRETHSGYSSPILTNGSDEESEGEHSDYHEEMLKGDVNLDLNLHPTTGRRYSRRQSAIPTTHTTITSLSPSSIPPSSSKELSPQDNNSSLAATGLGVRKHSFSFSSSFSGEQELWTPFSFEHDFDTVFLHDPSTAHHIPFNIATPESISVSELDNYFANPTNASTHRSQRKSFSSSMLGPNDKSLLQKVLLASAARGVADKIEEEDEKEIESNKEAAPTKVDSSLSVKNELTSKTDNAADMDKVTDDINKEDNPLVISMTDDNKKTESKTPITIKPIPSSNTLNVDVSENFVKFEEDKKKDIQPIPAPINTTPSPSIKKMADILPATNSASSSTTLSAAEILKSMNIQNLNLSALHQMTSTIPSLQHLSPTFDLAKTMAAYMQSLAKSANASPSSPSSSTHAMDLKSILARFPALEAFIKKDPLVGTSSGTSTPPLLSPTTTEFVPNFINAQNSNANNINTDGADPIVNTLTATNPPMYITVIDNVPVCICVLAKTEHTPEYRLMRRVDTGFINGTILLTAGGIETESERSMILSFEMERVRMPKKQSQLFGTWIPLRRAQELAVTCSIQRKLGHFLEDSIESYFPSPLPIQITTRKPTRDNRLTALALAALRAESAKNNGFVVPPISRQSSSSGSLAAAQLQELLMTHPHKALKSNGILNGKAPLLSRMDDKDDIGLAQLKEESDVDIVNTSDSSVMSSNDEESDNETDRTNDKTKALDTSHPATMNLEEILSRVASKQPLHIHPRDLQKKRRQSSIIDNKSNDKDKVSELSEPVTKTTKTSHQQQTTSRKKNSSSNGGKWSSNSNKSTNNNNSTKRSNNNSSNSSGPTITIKRSPSSNNHGKKNNAKLVSASKESENEEKIVNVVVEHKPSTNSSLPPSSIKAETVETSINEDDEDEDIDIGGSDFDDDLR
ncbi:MAG: hypothetical protein EXX96DRAFT_525811 [Benjaminiella poitrasii]|nr:MAG: hypothetical protein EXX96DRAFT_525811 [Benjaminiella poitrasii]